MINLLDEELAIGDKIRAENSFDIPFEYPGLPLSDYADSGWGRVFNLRGPGSPVTLGPAGYDEHVGVVQVDISIADGRGVADLYAKASEVANAFHAGQDLVHGESKLRIGSVSVSADRVSGSWRRVSVSINYTKRNRRV